MTPKGAQSIARWCGVILAALAAILVSEPAQADSHGCSVTGYAVRSADDARALMQALTGANPAAAVSGGVNLDRRETWVVPENSRLIVVIDSDRPLTSGHADVVVASREFTLESGAGTPRTRIVSGAWIPPSSALVRTFGVRAAQDGGNCHGQITISTDRHPLSTVAGGGGLAVAIVFSALALLVALHRRGRRRITAPLAGVLGFIGGLGEMVVLHESAVISPFSGWILAIPFVTAAFCAGLAILAPRKLTVGEDTGKSIPAGTVLGGRYKILSVMGQGGTGIVYRALDSTSGKTIAVKALLPKLANDAVFVERFRAEAELMRRLEHPHCVRFIDFLTVPGLVAIVTEYIPGVSLRTLIAQRGRLSGEQALTVMAGALRGLAYLHANNLVHRDVKPDNILLNRHGDSKLIDYGLVRDRADITGPVEGSPSYISPEQISNSPLDQRSDVYSMGAVLCELLTGKPPFSAPTVSGILTAHLVQPVPDIGASYGIHPALAGLTTRALAKNPAERPPSAMEFLTELESAAAEAYGVGWLARASVGGLVSGAVSTAAGIAGAAAVSTASATSITAGASSSIGAKLATIAKPLVGAVAASVIAASAAVASPDTNGPAPIVTPSQARAIFLSTWDNVRSGTLDPYVAAEARDTAQRLSEQRLENSTPTGPPLSELPLTVVGVGVPYQTAYPGFFVGYGHISWVSGERASGRHVVALFTKESADRPWTMVSLSLSDDTTPLPRLALDENGFATLLTDQVKSRLATDPGVLPQRYSDWGNRSIQAGSVTAEKLFRPGPYTTRRIEVIVKNSQQRSEGFFDETTLTPGTTAKFGIVLADGSAIVFFAVTYLNRGSNRAEDPAGGICDEGNRQKYTYFPNPGGIYPAGNKRRIDVTYRYDFSAVVPAGKPESNPVTVLSYQRTVTKVDSTPC